MMKKIAGQLKDLDLLKLLVLLCNKKDHTGKITFKHDDEYGEIYIDSGKILHAIFLRSLEGTDALYTLLTWENGDFEFINDEKPSKITINIDTKSLLTDCVNKKKELTVIKDLIPGLDSVFKLSGRTNTPQVNLSVDEIFIISFIDGIKSLREIEKLSGRNRFDLFKILYRFLSFDIVVKVEEASFEKETLVSKELFENMEKRLKLVAGPVTELMLGKCVMNLGYEKSSLPVSKLLDLLEAFVKEVGIKKERINDIEKDVQRIIASDSMTFPTNILPKDKVEEKKGGFFSLFKFQK